MNARDVREAVESFRMAQAPERTPEDCFPAWYLNHTYGISAVQAVMQSSDPALVGKSKGDFGLDGFHIDAQAEGQGKVVLVQAKYTESTAQIAKGFRDLERSLRHVREILNGLSSPKIENKVYVNLRAAVQERPVATLRGGALDFELKVVHLCEQDRMMIVGNCRKAVDDLKEEFRTLFPDARCLVEPVGPPEMSGRIIVAPGDDWFTLHLSAVPLEASLGDRQVKMYLGIGLLGEIIELYNRRRDDLFSKNVRYFLKSKRNVEKGPSGRIRETLKQICASPGDSTQAPGIFAFYHNGITLFARDLRLSEDKGTASVREPFVLNGCQTIKTGYYFHTDPRIHSRIDRERWSQIKVPLRIITTTDEEIIRQITVGNNRQNQISSSSLRANDPVQVELAERFKRRGIFYQRQEGAFDELEETNPASIKNDYPETDGGYVDIEELGRSLAATAGEFDFAQSPSHIFEYDAAYQRCFCPKRLRSVALLTFLQNLHDVLSVVLKKDLGLEYRGQGPRPTRLTYYAMCLLMRYLAKKKEHEFLAEYGSAIHGKHHAFREEVRSRLDNYHSGIKGALKDKFLTLEDARAESLKSAFQRAEAVLYLRSNVDPFETFEGLDDRDPD